MTTPSVSVIVPTWNRAELLAYAVMSVQAQTFADWELIVADDGSTDETSAVLARIAEPRVSVLSLTHSGNAGRVRNAALQIARGRYVAFLDSDDEWLPNKLSLQLPELERSGCRWGYTSLRWMNVEGEDIASMGEPTRLPAGDIFESVLRLEANIALPTVMAELSLLREAGGFNETYFQVEDYELWMRLAEVSPAHVTALPLTRVRVHANRLHLDPLARESAWIRLYRGRVASTRDARLRALCRSRVKEHRFRLVRAASALGEVGVASRSLFAAANLWYRWEFWLEVCRLLLRPFPRVRSVARRIVSRR